MRPTSPVALVVLAASALIAAGITVTVGHAARPKPAHRFLITAARRPYYAPERLEIVAEDGHVIRLVAGQAGAAALAPNHKLIAWGGTGGLHVEKVDGSESRLLVRLDCPAKNKRFAVCGQRFVWSPDSRKLLFVEGNNGLAVVSLSTGAPHQIVAPQKHVFYSPVAWSGPAREILFTASDAGGANGVGCCSEKLIIARPSGASQRTLYTAADPIHDAAAASWSPNGRWISFTTDGRGAPRDPRLAIVDAATGAMKRVRSYNGYTEAPIWSPDSKRFALGGHQTRIGIFTRVGAKLGTRKPTSATPVAWTGGGMYVIPGGNASQQLFVIPTGQRSARTVFTVPEGQVLNTVQPF